ncbi:MAG: glycerate kinase [Polaromonas sp.]|nr:glycerate kinase [Polaromonas sp.]
MNFQRILIPVAGVAVVLMAYRFYGWLGVVGSVGVLVFWLLLHFTRLLHILKRAANRPIGHVDSAVMLNAKLKPGMTLMHVVAMTRSLGVLQSPKAAQPEIYRWTDGSDSHLTCIFASGKLAEHAMVRPAPQAAQAPEAAQAAP